MFQNKILFYLKFGNKNLWRRKIRTYLLGLSFMFFSIISILFLGYSQGLTRQMLGGAINNFLGNAVICSKDSVMNALWYEKIKSFNCTSITKKINDSDLILTKQYSTRAFLYTKNNQHIALLIGVENTYKNKLKIIKGHNLSYSNLHDNEVLITSSIAEKMKIDVGDIISIETVTSDGRRNFDYFFIKGIYQILGTSEMLVGHIIIASLKDVQFLMNENENNVTQILVNRKDKSTETINNILQNKINDNSFKILDWKEYGNLLVGIVNIFVVTIWIVLSITMIIIGVFLFDSILSNIIERKKEYGTMVSMGLSKWQIGGLVLGEFTMLTIYFVLPGLIIGWIIVNFIGKTGIPIDSQIVKIMMGGFDNIVPFIDVISIIYLFIGILVFIQIVSLYSIIKINKLNPVEILKND